MTRDRHDAAKEFEMLLGRLEGSPAAASALVPAIRETAARAGFSEAETLRRGAEAFRQFAEKALADDVLSEAEEVGLMSIADALALTQERLQSDYKELLLRLVIARVNDGRMPVLDAPQLMTKTGELVHLETAALLMKEVAVREYRGGYQGFSFRIAKGVRYHVGGTRGRSVVVGTALQEKDAGIFSVTSHRAVFMGRSSTIELPFAKLAGVNVFDDGIQLHVTNRKTAPLFKLDSGGHVVAAIINTAAQRL